jgi:hypothetical protein
MKTHQIRQLEVASPIFTVAVPVLFPKSGPRNCFPSGFRKHRPEGAQHEVCKIGIGGLKASAFFAFLCAGSQRRARLLLAPF